MRRDRSCQSDAPLVGEPGNPAPARQRAGAAGGRALRAASSAPPTPFGAAPVRTVLAAVDGNPFGEHALPFAVGAAMRAGAVLRIVHVFSSWDTAGQASQLAAGAQWVLDQQRRRSEYLDGLIRRLKHAHPLAVTGALLNGADVAEAVCKASTAADLVVMATRNRGAWAKFWRGSITAAVARRARCAVLLVRGRDDPPDLTAAHLPHDIPLPFGGTKRAEGAVRAAAVRS